jgi:excisionase family DNA binding protein
MKNQEFLSTTELAKILGISRISVFNKIKKGEIKAIKIGRNFAIDKNSIGELLERETSRARKKEIDMAVKKTVDEYGETLKLLASV